MHTHTHLDLGANSLEHIDGHTRFEVLNRIHFRHQSTSHLVREKKAESKKHMICPRIHSCCSIAMYRVCDRKMEGQVILPYEDATITQKNMEHQAHVCANASNTRVRARAHTHTHTHTHTMTERARARARNPHTRIYTATCPISSRGGHHIPPPLRLTPPESSGTSYMPADRGGQQATDLLSEI